MNNVISHNGRCVNILILSCGTRNKIVQYFKKEFQGDGKVVAADASPLAPALYDADKFYIVPKISASNYLEVILDICQREDISGILSLIDPELSLLAKNQDIFRKIGVTVISSDYFICERCLDKWQMYQWLKAHGYKCANSYIDINKFYRAVEEGVIAYPVLVKPVRGSASLSIHKANDKETVELLMTHGKEFMIQEFFNGKEIGVDCILTLFRGK